ncbi:MAG TPA: glycosyltransferase, partial [Polyangia bacterium]
ELNPPPDRAAFRAIFAALASRDQPHAVVVGWVRHAWAARILVAARVVSTLPGWRRLVFLTESDDRALAALLAIEDLAKPLAEAARPFVGGRADEQFLQWLQTEPDVPPPAEFIGGSAAFAERVRDTHRIRIEAALTNRTRLDAVINRQSLGETLAVLEGIARGSSPRPLRVLVATSLYSDVVQYAAVDLADAFKKLGHEVCLVRESQPGEMIHYQSLTARTLEFRPDFAFLLNHLRTEAKAFHPQHLPFVTWIQDELPALKDKAMIAELGPLDFAYGFSVAVRDIYRNLGYPHVGHLPFAISGEGLDDEIPTDCRNEVVFPTHVTKPVEPPYVRGFGDYLEKRFATRRLIAVSMEPLSKLLDEASAKLNFAPMSPSDRQQAVFYALMFARRLDRIRIADAFLDNNLPIALYGKGWDEIPRFAPHHRGQVPGGAPLRKVLREHKVVLHRGYNMHPRLLEGFAVGAFVLSQFADTDTQPGEICDQFEVGREVHLFKEPEEMVRLTHRALSDEPWRREVIEAARARIRANHTYASRARTIIEDLRIGIASFLANT